VEGLSKAPAGNPIVLDLDLDRDGILKVSAREKKTGLEHRITIDRALSRFDQNDLDHARQRIHALFDDDGDNDDKEGPDDEAGAFSTTTDPDLEELLIRAGGKLDSVGEEDRGELIDLIEIIRDALAAGDRTAIENARQQLTDLLFYLET